MSYAYVSMSSKSYKQPKASKPASPKQVSLINKLAAEKQGGKVYVDTQLAAYKVPSVEALRSHQATNVIGVMLDFPNGKSSAAKATAPSVTVEEGFYWSETDQKVYRVVKSKSSDNLYAKVLVPASTPKGKGTWEYAQGAMKAASTWTKMDGAFASSVGRKVGYCCRCGATLTDPKSIEAGIGPVCATKF